MNVRFLEFLQNDINQIELQSVIVGKYNYRIDSKLSRKKDRQTYKCMILENKQMAVLKAINIQQLDDALQWGMIMNDINYMENLENVNILKIIDKFQIKKRFYIVTEFCPLLDMQSYLSQRSIQSLPELYDFMRQITSALVFLHERDLVHRKISLDSILVSSNGLIKLRNFQFACQEKYEHGFDVPYDQYTAPEIMDQKHATKESDIWALGVLFYKLVHGHFPYFYPESSDGDRSPRYRLKLGPFLDVSCKQILLSMLQHNPSIRADINSLYQFFSTSSTPRPIIKIFCPNSSESSSNAINSNFFKALRKITKKTKLNTNISNLQTQTSRAQDLQSVRNETLRSQQDLTKNSQLSSRTPVIEDTSPRHRQHFIKSLHITKPGMDSPKLLQQAKTTSTINKAKTQRIEYFSDNNLFKYVGFIKSLYVEADIQRQSIPSVQTLPQHKTQFITLAKLSLLLHQYLLSLTEFYKVYLPDIYKEVQGTYMIRFQKFSDNKHLDSMLKYDTHFKKHFRLSVGSASDLKKGLISYVQLLTRQEALTIKTAAFHEKLEQLLYILSKTDENGHKILQKINLGYEDTQKPKKQQPLWIRELLDEK